MAFRRFASSAVRPAKTQLIGHAIRILHARRNALTRHFACIANGSRRTNATTWIRIGHSSRTIHCFTPQIFTTRALINADVNAIHNDRLWIDAITGPWNKPRTTR
jgi:hypothetical protein